MIKFLLVILIVLPAFISAQINPKDAISQMTKGINLGNTLEPAYEGEWGNPSTQEYMFDMYKKEGFNCIRIPVRWDKHTSTSSPYKIDETWFKRVEQILDWGLSRGMFMVVNSHHDDWIKTGYTNATNRARFDSIWSQISVRFKNKSEKLIFEVLNEPNGLTKIQNDDMHQRIISVIRKTNTTRLIIFQGHNWGGSDELISAAIPNDKYMIGSFHSYDPYPFGLVGTGTFGSTADVNALKTKFQRVKDWSVQNNIPVFLGEFGGTIKCDYNSRMKQYKTYVELCETFGFTPCAWDDGGDFRIMNRSARTWFVDIKDILAHSSVLSPKPKLSILQDTIIKLEWTNQAPDYDSIYIERRLSNTTFKRIAAVKGDQLAYSDKDLPQNKEYFYRVIARYNTNLNLYSNPQKILLPTYVPKEPAKRELFKGKPQEIPGRIEVENFDIGEDGLTYHDSDAKNVPGALRPDEPMDIYNLGGGKYYLIDNYPGEWLEYTVNVAEKGLYDITSSIASFEGGGTFSLKIGSVQSDPILAPTSFSWANAKTVNFSMNLESGIQIMRFSITDKPLFNIDFFDFKKNIPLGNIPDLTENQFNVIQNRQELIFDLGIGQQAETIKIYNILGSSVKTIQSPGTNFRISTQDFHSGVYIVQVISGNQKFSKKIIIH